VTINELAQEFWDGVLEDQPTLRHLLGDTSRAGDFEDPSRAAEDASIARMRALADRVEAVPVDGLSDDERTTRSVLLVEARTRADLAESRMSSHAADPIFGPQEELPLLTGMLGVPDETVAAAMTDKLRGVGRSLRALGERQLEGRAAGLDAPAFAVRGTIEQVERWLATPLSEDALVAAVTVPEGADEGRWRQEWAAVVESDVRPGLAAWADALREVADHGRPDDRVGLCHLPGGDETYAAALRYYTTTDKSAQEIHDLGLAQIASLAEEYRAMGPQVVGSDDLEEIFTAMREDPALHFTSGEQLVEASEVAMARAWEAMPDWFSILPKAPCAVTGTTTGAKAFYFPPATDGSRGGSFFINTSDPSSWGTFELEAMAFHEGIPGHHLQLAVASELPDSIPAVRRFSENAAYAEGWGLYTERLADEMGLYTGPVDRLGMLAADSMRACRLVVDTGLHALGWSRQQAVDYMVANSPLREGVVRPEIDRYIVTPGQACSYMVGRLEIERIRREAQARQGDAFDVKEFHSAVLDGGALPLGVLDEVVARRLP
jgi:uncharacterized protein (DUF885 family)